MDETFLFAEITQHLFTPCLNIDLKCEECEVTREVYGFLIFPTGTTGSFPIAEGFPGIFCGNFTCFSQNVPDRTFRWPRKYQGGVCNAEHGQRRAFRLLMSTAFFQTMHWLSLVSVQPANSHRMDNYVNVEYVQRSHLASRL